MQKLESDKNQTYQSFLPAKRKKNGWVLVEGERFVREAFKGNWVIHCLIVSESVQKNAEANELIRKAKAQRTKVYILTDRLYKKLSSLESQTGTAVLVSPPENDQKSFFQGTRFLILDGVQDPGNAGTLVRSASAFGFRTILLPGGVSLSNEKFVRSTAGNCFHKHSIIQVDDREYLQKCLVERDVTVMLFDSHSGTDLEKFESKTEKLAIVLGSEGPGIDEKAWSKAEKINIMMEPDVESLNVAVTGSIAMYRLRETFE